jgi:hypothetical protein
MEVTLSPRLFAMELIEVRSTGGLYFRIEPELQEPIDPNGATRGCACAYCKAHPDQVPKWDTLAVHPQSRWTWRVHMPDPSNDWRKHHKFTP